MIMIKEEKIWQRCSEFLWKCRILWDVVREYNIPIAPNLTVNSLSLTVNTIKNESIFRIHSSAHAID